MKFLLDANLPYSAKEVFTKHEVFHVRDIGLSSANDQEIIDWANENQAILITRDLDFANILNYPPEKYFGIIVLRLPSSSSAKNIKEYLESFLQKIKTINLQSSIVIVEANRYRIRRFK